MLTSARRPARFCARVQAADAESLVAQLRVLDDLSRRLEEEVCAERTRCEGVEELLQIERVRAPILAPLPARQP